MIEQIIMEEVLKETSFMGGFSVNKLKSLSKNDVFGPNVWDYVKELGLKELGHGSSRTVFLISPKKVLKVGWGEKGLAQNEAEVEVATNPATKNIVTRIFDYDPKYQWLVSEFVREFKSSEEDKFERLTGFKWNLLSEFINEVKNFENIKDVFDFLERLFINVTNSQWSSQIKKSFYKEMLKELKSREFVLFATNLFNIMKSSNLVGGDIKWLAHWGQTGEGRVVLLDYGFSEDVATKYY